MAKYNTEGSIYIKNYTGVEVAASGYETGVFAKAIPPYCVVEEYWATVWVTGTEAMAPHEKQQFKYSGRMANMPGEIEDLANAGSHDSLEELMGAYMPLDAWFEGNEESEMNVGLGSHSDPSGAPSRRQSTISKEREFCNYDTLLGARNAYMTAQNKIRYATQFHQRGKVSGHGCNVDSWRLIAFGARTNTIDDNINTNVRKHVFGSSTPDIRGLQQGVFQLFGDEGMEVMPGSRDDQGTWESVGTTVNMERHGLREAMTIPLVTDWANAGFGSAGSWSAGTEDDADSGSGFSNDCALVVQSKITLRLKNIKRNPSKVYTPW